MIKEERRDNLYMITTFLGSLLREKVDDYENRGWTVKGREQLDNTIDAVCAFVYSGVNDYWDELSKDREIYGRESGDKL